jgi:transposase
LRHFLTAQGCKPVIALKPNRINKPDFEANAYKQRNLIERAFCRIKDWRATATRYDKRAANFLAGLCLAVTLTFWIR